MTKPTRTKATEAFNKIHATLSVLCCWGTTISVHRERNLMRFKWCAFSLIKYSITVHYSALPKLTAPHWVVVPGAGKPTGSPGAGLPRLQPERSPVPHRYLEIPAATAKPWPSDRPLEAAALRGAMPWTRWPGCTTSQQEPSPSAEPNAWHTLACLTQEDRNGRIISPNLTGLLRLPALRFLFFFQLWGLVEVCMV